MRVAFLWLSLATAASGLSGCRGHQEPVLPAKRPERPPDSPARPAPPTPPVEPQTADPASDATAAEDPCVTECVRERQMQATSIEKIRADCAAQCEAANGQDD